MQVSLSTTLLLLPSRCECLLDACHRIAFALPPGHVYHALAFNLKPNEVRHHLIFSGIGGVMTLGMGWGPLMNLCLFLMSGLPGAIDYTMLAAVKCDRMPRLREKQLNTLLNTWLRIPGLVMVGVIAWCCLIHDANPRLPPWFLMLSIAMALANGLHYGAQVIGSYHRELALVAQSMEAYPVSEEKKAEAVGGSRAASRVS